MTDIANLNVRVRVVTDDDIEEEVERRVKDRLGKMHGKVVIHTETCDQDPDVVTSGGTNVTVCGVRVDGVLRAEVICAAGEVWKARFEVLINPVRDIVEALPK